MTLPPETPETVVPAASPAVGAAGRYAHPLELGTMAIIVALDQVTKATVRLLLPLGESRRIIPQLLDLTHVHNTGAAFGLLKKLRIALPASLKTLGQFELVKCSFLYVEHFRRSIEPDEHTGTAKPLQRICFRFSHFRPPSMKHVSAVLMSRSAPRPPAPDFCSHFPSVLQMES